MNIETRELLQSIEKMLEEKLEEKLEQKLDEKLDQKLDEKLDQKLDKKLDEKLEQKLNPKFDSIQNQILEMQGQISELQKETKSISRSVAIIEHDHGQKLDALFDAFKMNNEKIEKQEKRISLYERKIEQHDDDIFYLKNKVQGL